MATTVHTSIITHVQTVTPITNTLKNTTGLFLVHVKTAQPGQSAFFGSLPQTVYISLPQTVYTRRHCHTCTDSHTHQCYVVRNQMILIIFCLRRVWIQQQFILLNPQSINADAHHQHYGAESSHQLITVMIACTLSTTIHPHLERQTATVRAASHAFFKGKVLGRDRTSDGRSSDHCGLAFLMAYTRFPPHGLPTVESYGVIHVTHVLPRPTVAFSCIHVDLCS